MRFQRTEEPGRSRRLAGDKHADEARAPRARRLLVDHMPRERFVQDDPEVCGPHYNLTGLGLARRLMFRCLHIDAAHGWVQVRAWARSRPIPSAAPQRE
jgi:hypothetical protein